MRILHAVLSEGFYGSERYCAELAVAQAREGHDVQIVTLGRSSDCTRAVRSAIADAGDHLQLIPLRHHLPALLHRPFAYALLARFQPHIVHTHLDPATRRIGRVAQRLGFGHVATLHLSFSAPEYGACNGLVCIADWQRKTLPADFAGRNEIIDFALVLCAIWRQRNSNLCNGRAFGCGRKICGAKIRSSVACRRALLPPRPLAIWLCDPGRNHRRPPPFARQ